MKRRLLYCTVLILIFSSFSLLTSGQEGWTDQTPYPNLTGLYAVYAIDSEDIWVVGEGGLILHSLDGGESWDSIPSGTEETLYTVEFINSDTGWVAGDDNAVKPTVLRTVNGGESWEPQELAGTGAIMIYDVDFVKGGPDDPILGYITGGLGFTWLTEDFGAYWGPIRNDCENTFYSSWFVNQDTGWFVGTPSVAEPYTIMRTTDGGETWEQQQNPTERNLRGVSFGSESKGVAAGLMGAIIYTSDGGELWETSDDGGVYRWESVYMTSSGKAWAVGQNSNIAYSEDWGHTWSDQESDILPARELWEVYFIDDQEGWIVGGGIGQPGVILHTTNGGVTSGGNTGIAEVQETFGLEQNYPNPFSGSTRIGFTIPDATHVKIALYDAIGKLAQVLYDQYTPAGRHQFDLNGSLLHPGIYYYTIEAGRYLETRKMTLSQ